MADSPTARQEQRRLHGEGCWLARFGLSHARVLSINHSGWRTSPGPTKVWRRPSSEAPAQRKYMCWYLYIQLYDEVVVLSRALTAGSRISSWTVLSGQKVTPRINGSSNAHVTPM